MLDYSKIQKYIESGLITSRKHPTLPLEILNYTQRVQFDRLWDEYTKMCRGLILDNFHNIVARPFPKFFNLGETQETMIQNLPNEIPQITEKFDGSLGISFPDGENISIATRGAFESEQAVWATKWIREKGYTIYDFKLDYTYLFEIIYPESKNVVDYKEFQGLVLLAVISNKDGTEIDHKEEAKIIDFPYAKTYDFEDISHVVDFANTMSGTNLEGFVCKYSNGLRVKIKSEDYKRLHKILSGFGEKDIWEALSQGKSLDSMVEIVPDEFFEWIKVTQLKFWNQRRILIDEAKEISLKASQMPSRKEQAIYITTVCKNKPKGFSGLIFNLLDGRTEEAERSVWNMLKP